MNYKISLLVPTRERANLFKGFLHSVYQTTHHKENIEILIMCDDDDKFSQEYVGRAIQELGSQMNVTLHTRPRSEMLNENYYNELARKASGDLLWVMADDLVIVKPGWDDDVQREAESIFFKYPDRILCFSIRDNTPPPSHKLPKFPCFPMLTKEARQALGGWILHPKVPTWGADFITYCIFQPIDRLVELHAQNYINHISWHNKQVKIDAVNERIGSIFNKYKMVPHHNTDRIIDEEVNNIRLQLKECIKQYNLANPTTSPTAIP
jgi:hypothetical protein